MADTGSCDGVTTLISASSLCILVLKMDEEVGVPGDGPWSGAD